ncbi:hypothetical protein FIBSPDRAFT_966319 [Athelia psychrophila]|uniref:Uncharacterized protein n=1 Tax=Athelia psychrophila TaxID=1759441 RepID=A0A167WWW0_9AGAM|nr:hypothetical protein FIBSPDRAFT_966319 [Fibularhizoctonia sp. CBS 109695]
MSTNPTAPTADKGDYLDQAVAMATSKGGHATDRKTTEKISDAVRSFFKKITGKDVPVADKN